MFGGTEPQSSNGYLQEPLSLREEFRSRRFGLGHSNPLQAFMTASGLRGPKSHSKIVAEKLNKYWGQQNVELESLEHCWWCKLFASPRHKLPTQSGSPDSKRPLQALVSRPKNIQWKSAVDSRPLFVNNTKWEKWVVAAAARVCMAQCRRPCSPGVRLRCRLPWQTLPLESPLSTPLGRPPTPSLPAAFTSNWEIAANAFRFFVFLGQALAFHIA